MQARVVKAHDVRRDEILGCAERLFARQGYEGTTVSAIIEETGIAKGTFYHYFASKEELLNGLVERLSSRILAAVDPILDDDAPAPDKLRRIHETGGAIRSVLYKPENLLARHKMGERMLQTTIPLYARVIRQGIDEGTFHTTRPDEAAEFLLIAWRGLGDAITGLLLASGSRPEHLRQALRKLEAYDDIAERVLGAAPGSLRLADAARPTLEALRQPSTVAAGGRS